MKEEIRKLINLALENKNNECHRLYMKPISNNIAERIEQVTGFRVYEYVHTIDTCSIKHAINQHGNAIKEEKRGQIAVTLDVFEQIPSIITNPDEIIDGGKNRIGRDCIIYKKRINGYVVYIEEIRTGKKELAFHTMYIKRPD